VRRATSALVAAVVLIAIQGCSGAHGHDRTTTSDPSDGVLGRVLFRRTTPTGIEVSARLRKIGCRELLTARLVHGSQMMTIGGLHSIDRSTASVSLEIVDAKWDALTVLVTDDRVHTVEWTDNRGRGDAMSPVDHWAVLAAGILARDAQGPRPLDRTSVTGRDAGGAIVATVAVPDLESELPPRPPPCP